MSARPTTSLLRRLLDETEEPLFVVDGNDRIRFANTAAEESTGLEAAVRDLRDGRTATVLSGRRVELRARPLDGGLTAVFGRWLGDDGPELEPLFDRLKDAVAVHAPDLLRQIEEIEMRLEMQRSDGRRTLAASRRLTDSAVDARGRSQELFDHSPVAQVVTDLNGKVVDANGLAVELLGARKLEGRLLVSFLSLPDRAAFRSSLRQIAKEIDVVHMSVVLDRGSADERAVLATARVVEGSEPPRVHWLLVDRSELREAERELPSDDDLLRRLARTNVDRLRAAYRELAVERGRLQRVLGRFPGGLVAVDSELRVLFSNAAARRILFPHPLARGDLLPDVWEGLSLREYAVTLFEPHGALVERKVDLNDGRVIEVNGIPHRTGGDAFVLLSDVTAEARRLRTEREFVRNAAHELRTPLTAISTAIEVLQGGAKEIPDDRDRFLAHIESQCTRLNRLIQSLLVLARAQSDQQPPRLEFVPLRPLLEEVAASLRPAESVEIVVDCDPDLALFADRDLAEHGVLNVALNATRHTRRGTIRLLAQAVDERRVEIVVADEGDGILPEHRDRLFEPFFRGGTRDGDGFGLGLAISSQAISTLGGTLELESEPGIGTRAVISLPSARLVETR